MADPKKPDDLTLPGTLPGLRRLGSPIVTDEGWPGVVGTVEGAAGEALFFDPVTGHPQQAEYEAHRVHLDLTDKTGRVHASWWALERMPSLLTDSGADGLVVRLAMQGRNMSDTQIAMLRDLCLRLAGGSDV